MVKDLDRPSSEMNIHGSNMLRNSFILEENEEDIQQQQSNEFSELAQIEENKKLASNSIDNMEKNSDDLPFPELVFINLADNQVINRKIV